MSDPLAAIKSRLDGTNSVWLLAEARKYLTNYVDMGHFTRPAEALPYLVDGFQLGYLQASKSPDIAKLVAAVELADNRFKEACQCVQRKWPCAFCAARFEINKILEGGE